MMAAGGVQDLIHTRNVVELFTQLHYPLYLATILGVCKLLGVAALLAPKLPRLKEWAYAGFTFDLLGAAVSAAVVGGMFGRVVFPLAFFALLIPSYLLRPTARRTGGPSVSSLT